MLHHVDGRHPRLAQRSCWNEIGINIRPGLRQQGMCQFGKIKIRRRQEGGLRNSGVSYLLAEMPPHSGIALQMPVVSGDFFGNACVLKRIGGMLQKHEFWESITICRTNCTKLTRKRSLPNNNYQPRGLKPRGRPKRRATASPLWKPHR